MKLRLTRNDLDTYAGLSRVGGDIKQGMKDWAMSDAANVNPTQEYSPDQAAQLEAAAGAKDAEGNPFYQVKANEGGTYSVTPTAGGETGTLTPGLYRMGGKTQETPFAQEQIEGQRFRNQSDVAMRSGDYREAAGLQELAKQRDEEGVNSKIRTGAMDGIKNTKDMRDEEKMFSISKGMYEQALRLGRPDLASGYYNQMTQNRDVLLNRSNDRADRVYRATGNLGGYVDSYNRYVADGITIDAFKSNKDGSHVFTINDGAGNTRDVAVPKDGVKEYLMALRDPNRIAELEAKRAEILFKASSDAQEKLNTPVAVGKDQTLVIPSTGQTFAPRQPGLDVKESSQVLGDARKILLEQSGNFDQGSGKWNWSPEARAKAVIAERLFMKNQSLTPAQLAEIADKGTTGTAVVEIGGKQQRVPAVTHGSKTFILGESDVGYDTPATPQPIKSSPLTTTGIGTRDVRGKISPAQARAPGLTPITPQKNAEPIAYNAPELDQLAVTAAEENGIPPKLLLALKNAGEKSNNNQVSKKGASGVMQFMPETAKAYGIDPTNPESAIKGASRYLSDLIKQYRGNMAAAVAHYNGGSTQGSLVAAGKEPTSPETRAYLQRVLAAAG